MSRSESTSTQAAVSGRLPVLQEERIYSTYGSLLRTIITIGSAVWVFLMGSALPVVGDTRLAIVGFTCGLLMAAIICLVSAAVPSFRYGLDCVDISKPFLGSRGSVLPLAGLLLTALGWASVATAMIARGAGQLMHSWTGGLGMTSEGTIVLVGLAVLVLCWILLRIGVRFVQKMNDFVGPGLLGIAAISMALLVRKYGLHTLWITNVPPAAALTTDRRKCLAYAFEFGITYCVVWWPYISGLYRLLKHRRDIAGPLMNGTLASSAFCAIVATLAATNTGSADPLVWIVALAGREAGSLLVCLILLMNVPALCMLLYFAGVSVQQVRVLARVRWSALVTLMILPLMAAVFHTEWVLAHVITLSTYGGLMFLGISAVAIVDYYLLRHQFVALDQAFVTGPGGSYWFWGGVNWVAVIIMAAGTKVYLRMYDPISMSASGGFRYMGAALPMMAGVAAVYYLVMRIFVVHTSRGGYRNAHDDQPTSMTVEVRL